MTDNNPEFIDTNAQSSAFGWDFQSSLALFFVSKDLKNLDKVKVEGRTEDIELYYEDGRTVFIQAKSQKNPYSSSNTNKHLTSAMKTLINTSLKSEYTTLYYGTNISNPFVYKEFQGLFLGGPTDYTFDELSEKIQTKIKKSVEIAAKDEELSLMKFDYNCLRICTLPFFGDDDDTRYRYIKENIEIFLDKLDIRRPVVSRIFDYYQLIFSKNSSKSIDIKKKELAWPIIIFSLDTNSDEFFTEFDLDMSEEDAVENIYQDFIDKKSLDFSLITEIINDFSAFLKTKNYTDRRSTPVIFIKQNWSFYSGKIFSDELSEIAEPVTQLIMWKIIKKNKIIKKLQKEVNL